MTTERLPIIENDPFRVTEQSILETIAELQDEISDIKRTSEDPDEDEKIKARVLTFLPRMERNLAALTTGSPSEILTKMQGIYTQTEALARTGMSELDIAAEIYQRYPEITTYSDLIEPKTRWGYNLIQTIAAHKMFKSPGQ